MKTLLVALLLLVVGTGTASAECAWVLWTETQAMSKDKAGNWETVSFDRNVYETRKACEVALVKWMKDKVQIWGRDEGIKVFRHDEDTSDFKGRFMRIDIPRRRVTDVFKEKDTGETRDLIVYQYTCLPDTVDPRGPKGAR